MPENEKSVFQVRLDKNLRDAFIRTVKSRDRTAAQEVRDFMREYLKKHGQMDLFNK